MIKFLIAILIWLNCSVSLAAQVEEISDAEKAKRGIKIVSERLKKDYPLSIETRIFFPNMDGHIKSHEIKIGNDALSLKNFGMDSNVAPEYILRYKNISVDYIRLKGDGRNFVEGMTFGGKIFNGAVNAESDLHYIKLNIDREIISLMGTRAAWDYGLTGVKWRGNVEGITEKYFFPIPTIGIALEMKIRPKVKVYTDISGVVLGRYGHLCDFEGGFAYLADENFSWKVGYRHIDTKINWRNVHGDFKLNGFYTGLRAEF